MWWGTFFFFLFLYQFPVKFYLIAFGLFLPLSDNRRLACCLHNMNYFTLLFYFRQSTQPFLNDARSISFHHYCMFSKRKAVTSADCKSHCDWFCNFHLPQISFSPIVSVFPSHFTSIPSSSFLSLRQCKYESSWRLRQKMGKNVYFRCVSHVLMYSFKKIDTVAREKD